MTRYSESNERNSVVGIVAFVLVPSVAVVGLLLLLFQAVEWRLLRVDVNTSNGGILFYDDQQADRDKLRFGVATMVNIESTYRKYHRISETVAASLGSRDAFLIEPSYRDLRRALEHGELDVAMTCTGIYTHAALAGGARLVAKPKYEGDLTYHGLLVVRAESPVESFDDLRGKEIIFTDPESFTGHILPIAEIIRRGHDPERFFSRARFAGCHDVAIKGVDRRIADAAAVSSIKWHLMTRDDPTLADRLRVVWRSEEFGLPPVLAPPTMEDDSFSALREVFLNLHENENVSAALRELSIERFVEVSESDYRSALDVHELVKRSVEGAAP